MTDSPGAFYANSTDASLTLATPLNFNPVTRPVMSFRHRYSLEAGYDFGRVEVSTSGSTWQAPALSFTGDSNGFIADQLDLAAWQTATTFRVRFRLLTDPSVVRDGWYIDDVKIGSAPAPVGLGAPTGIGRNSLNLPWTAAVAGDFAAYEIYRSLTPGVDWRTAWKVATLTDRTTVAFTDATLAPKTAYYYRVAVVNPDGFRSFSNEVTATTLAGMDFPVLDNAEAGGAIWTADAPWAISNELGASGSHSWSDSPGADYQPGITSQSLTLAAPVNLSATTDPVLCFQHRHALGGGDYGYVEVSTNNGTDWTNLATFSGSSPDNTWLRGRVSLAAYKQSAVLVRFRLTSDPGGVADGWHVDDISISESPPVVAAPAVDQITSNGARLAWQQSADPLVVRYAVMRSTTAGTGMNSTLAAMVEGRASTLFTDSGLLLDTNYYYRVYALNSYGGISADSPVEAQVHTLNNPPPFADSFEGGTQGWVFNGSWAVTSEIAATGSKCLTDSPGASYQNSRDTWAETSIDLRGTDWPVLTFKDRYSLSGGDWLRVEIYDANQTWVWMAPYGAYESAPRTEWREQRIDLSPFKGRANVRVRFRVGTDGGTPGDGWFIDDVSVTENPLATAPLTLPMQESFESGLTNWISAGWITSDSVTAKEGNRFAWDTEQDRLAPDSHQALTLVRPVVLPPGSNVQVTFLVNGIVNPGGWFRLQYSQDDGLSWPELSTANLDNGFNSGAGWHRLQASLGSLAGRTVRLRLVSHSDNGARAGDIRVDKLTIAEMPAAVTLTSAVPALRSVALIWTQSTLGAAFQRYELWRSTSANVSVQNGTRIFDSTSVAATAFTDTGLSIGTTYYYRVFAVDARDTFIPSNELSALTVPSSLPLNDTMDTLGNWVPGSTGAPNTWAVATGNPHGGSGSMATVASGQYANSSDTWMETAIDLTTAQWPVLTFWDRFGLGEGDWMRLEVYDSVQTWVWMNTCGVYGPMQRSEWRKQQVDLSPFKGRSNVRLRFRVGTDGGTPGEGWFIDDLSLAEHPLASSPQPLPLLEDFESGLANWISAGWITSDAITAKDGTHFAWSSDDLRIAQDSHRALTLARPIVLPAGSNVQVTFSVNGIINPGAWFRLQYSQDDGVSWPELGTANLDAGFNTGTNWSRLQASLASLAGKTIRLRLVSHSDNGARAEDVRVDKLTIAEMPAAVTMTSAIPALRSVALTWTPTTLGAAFQRYELWRSTSASVTVFNGAKIFESASAGTTTFTDTGLSIGTTYYYKVFAVDTRETFIPSNEMAALTVPSALPFTDSMESLGNWVPGSTGAPNTWAIATNNPHGGSGSMATIASGQYANSSDTWMETAVDLGTAQWPVLTFWDRFGLGEGDWLRLEVYDGVQTWMWMSTCGVYGPMQRSEWRKQQVDLSPFKGRSNVRLRFRVGTDGGTPGEGWFIDDLSLAENPLKDTPQTLPLQEDFEGGLANWISAGWITSDAITAKDGTHFAWSSDDLRIAPDSHRALTLARPIVLPAGSNVQVTFSVNGIINPGAWFRLQYSQDDGVSWPELGTANLDAGFNTGTNWSRLQASLASLAGKTVRLRLVSHSDNGARAEDVRVDKLTIAEMPAAVTMTSAIPALRSVALTWTPTTLGTDFQRYELWRSTSANVSVQNGTRIAEFPSAATVAYDDTGLLIGQSYFYRVFTVDSRDTFIPSNELTATTIPAILPLSDAMETTGNWMPGTTGAMNTWGIGTANVHGGSGCLALTTSGQYNNSSDTWMETSVDLRGTVWPVLTFWDRYALGDGDWLRVEIYDGNQTWFWASRYGVYGPATRAEWRQQKLDLSEFKDRGNIRIRFRVGTDGGTPSDGWFIDDLSLAENPLAATPLVMPFFDTAETTPLTAWQASHWSRVPDSLAPSGSYALLDTENARVAPDTANILTLAHPVTLPAGTNASVSYWMKGTLPGGSSFRLQYSENGGLSWPELTVANRDGGYSSTAWQLVQVPLSSLAGKTVRLRFASSSDNGARASDIYLDSIGIGDPQPAAPVLLSPVNAAWVSDVRPLLTLQNALDVQSDPLTYRFEVYSDEALTTVVAQNPAIAGGSGTTAWQVDVNLPNNTRYWWRARASDGTATGDWSAPADFYVNEVNHAPATVVQAGPPEGAVLTGLDDLLVWKPTTDQDAGDFITAYHIQVAADAAFTTPVISVNDITPPSQVRRDAQPVLSVTLGSLAGSDALTAGTVYHWRIRAADNRGAWSAWQSTPRTFQYLQAPPTPFEEWGTEHFTPAELNNPDISGPNADPDGDGVANLLEFAFNTVPVNPASRAVPQPGTSGESLALSFRQRIGGSGTPGIDYTVDGIRYTVESSISLLSGPWTSGPGTVAVTGTPVDNGDGTETITVMLPHPITQHPARFLRLKVSAVP